MDQDYFDEQRWFLLSGIALLVISLGLAILFLHKAREKQIQLINEKQELQRQLEEVLAGKQKESELFSTIAHDLRSPVVRLKSRLTFLKMKDESEQINILEQHTTHLLHTLDNILNWSLVQLDKIEPYPQSTNLSQIIDSLIEEFAGLIQQKELIIRFDRQPVTIWANEILTSLVIKNVLHNAIKFTPANGTIHISIRKGLTATELVVDDTGPGIAPDRITKQQFGLGLNLCFQLMKRTQGRLQIENKMKQGTRVTLSWTNTGL